MSKPDENEDTTVVGPISGRTADREPRLAIGELFGPYRVISVLGRGGIGEVFEVEHEVLRKRFALKLLLASTDSPDTRKRFIREAQVMAALDHNHIVRVDDFGETSGKVWLRMELAEGVIGRNGRPVHTLAELVADRGPRLPERETRSALVQILDALECAHGAGVVHRDLKPGNILLDRSGRLKIADFGLVQVVGEHWMREQHDAARSNPGTLGSASTMVHGDQAETEKAVMGTWEFMSPEQKAGGEIDARSDLYATGLIAFRLLTGEHVLAMERPTELVRDLNREWDTWIRRAVATRPERRFANAAEMRAALPTLDPVMDTELTPDPELSQREVRNHKVEESLLQSETAPAHEPAQTDVDIPSHEAGFKGTWRNLAGWLRTPRGPIADTESSPGSIPVRQIVAETPNALRALKRFEGLRTGRIRAALVNLFLPGLGHVLRGRPLVGGVFAAGGLAGADTRLWWGAGVVAMLVALFDSGKPSLSADDRKLGSRVRQFRVWYGIFTGLVIVVLVWGVLIVLAELGMVDLPRAFPRPDWTQSIITDLAVATGTLIVAFRLGAMLWAIVRLQRELSRGG